MPQGNIVTFCDKDFSGEGLELDINLAFLSVTDPLLRALSQIVHGYWIQLACTTNQSALCGEFPSGKCEGTFNICTFESHVHCSWWSVSHIQTIGSKALVTLLLRILGEYSRIVDISAVFRHQRDTTKLYGRRGLWLYLQWRTLVVS